MVLIALFLVLVLRLVAAGGVVGTVTGAIGGDKIASGLNSVRAIKKGAKYLNAVSNSLTNAVNGIKGAVTNIGTKAGETWDNIKSTASNLKTKLGDTFTSTVDGIKAQLH